MLLIVGTCGNLLSFIVLRQKALRIHATAYLLSVLALDDLACLYLGLLRRVVEYFVGYDVFRTSHEFLCRSQTFLVYLSLHYASWILVTVATERFISVWFPVKARVICTVRNAQISSIVTLLLLACVNCHFFFTATVKTGNNDPESAHHNTPLDTQKNYTIILQKTEKSSEDIANATANNGQRVCDARDEYEAFLSNVWPYIDMTVFCFIPFALMLVLNCTFHPTYYYIVVYIITIFFSVLIVARIFSIRRHTALQDEARRQLPGLTVIMFICCFSFFALTLPISVYMVARSRIDEDDPRNAVMMYVMWTFVNLLQYTSNAINFFLYILSGSLFRRELMKILRRWYWNLKSLFCCWYCYPDRRPKDYNDLAEFYIGHKPGKKNSRLGNQPIVYRLNESRLLKWFSFMRKKRERRPNDENYLAIAYGEPVDKANSHENDHMLVLAHRQPREDSEENSKKNTTPSADRYLKQLPPGITYDSEATEGNWHAAAKMETLLEEPEDSNCDEPSSSQIRRPSLAIVPEISPAQMDSPSDENPQLSPCHQKAPPRPRRDVFAAFGPMC